MERSKTEMETQKSKAEMERSKAEMERSKAEMQRSKAEMQGRPSNHITILTVWLLLRSTSSFFNICWRSHSHFSVPLVNDIKSSGGVSMLRWYLVVSVFLSLLNTNLYKWKWLKKNKKTKSTTATTLSGRKIAAWSFNMVLKKSVACNKDKPWT